MFDYRKFLNDNFRSPDGLLSFLRSFSAPLPERGTVQQWFVRGAVPGKWFPVLLAYKEIDDGAPVSIVDYVTGGM